MGKIDSKQLTDKIQNYRDNGKSCSQSVLTGICTTVDCKLSEEELLSNMYKIRKNELTYEGIRRNNTQYRVLIYSEGMIRERYPSSYSSGSDNIKDHDDINNIIIDKSLAYMYINE